MGLKRQRQDRNKKLSNICMSYSLLELINGDADEGAGQLVGNNLFIIVFKVPVHHCPWYHWLELFGLGLEKLLISDDLEDYEQDMPREPLR